MKLEIEFPEMFRYVSTINEPHLTRTILDLEKVSQFRVEFCADFRVDDKHERNPNSKVASRSVSLRRRLIIDVQWILGPKHTILGSSISTLMVKLDSLFLVSSEF